MDLSGQPSSWLAPQQYCGESWQKKLRRHLQGLKQQKPKACMTCSGKPRSPKKQRTERKACEKLFTAILAIVWKLVLSCQQALLPQQLRLHKVFYQQDLLLLAKSPCCSQRTSIRPPQLPSHRRWLYGNAIAFLLISVQAHSFAPTYISFKVDTGSPRDDDAHSHDASFNPASAVPPPAAPTPSSDVVAKPIGTLQGTCRVGADCDDRENGSPEVKEILSSALYVPGTDYHVSGNSITVDGIQAYGLYEEVLATITSASESFQRVASWECPPVSFSTSQHIGSWSKWTEDEKKIAEGSIYQKCVRSCNGWDMKPPCFFDCNTLQCVALTPIPGKITSLFKLRSGHLGAYIEGVWRNQPWKIDGVSIEPIESSFDDYLILRDSRIYGISEAEATKMSTAAVYYDRRRDLWTAIHSRIDTTYDEKKGKWTIRTHVPPLNLIDKSYRYTVNTTNPLKLGVHYASRPKRLQFRAPEYVSRTDRGDTCVILECRRPTSSDWAPYESTTTSRGTCVYVRTDHNGKQGRHCDVIDEIGNTHHVVHAEILQVVGRTIRSRNNITCFDEHEDSPVLEDTVTKLNTTTSDSSFNLDTKALTDFISTAYQSISKFFDGIWDKFIVAASVVLLIVVTRGSYLSIAAAIAAYSFYHMPVSHAAVIGGESMILESSMAAASIFVDISVEGASRHLPLALFAITIILGFGRDTTTKVESYVIMLLATSKNYPWIRALMLMVFISRRLRGPIREHASRAVSSARDYTNIITADCTLPMDKIQHLIQESTIGHKYVGKQIIIRSSQPIKRRVVTTSNIKHHRNKIIRELFYLEELPVVRPIIDTVTDADLRIMYFSYPGVHGRKPFDLDWLYAHTNDPPDGRAKR